MIEIKNDRKLTEKMTQRKVRLSGLSLGIVKDSCGNSFTGNSRIFKVGQKDIAAESGINRLAR